MSSGLAGCGRARATTESHNAREAQAAVRRQWMCEWSETGSDGEWSGDDDDDPLRKRFPTTPFRGVVGRFVALSISASRHHPPRCGTPYVAHNLFW